jgi:CheY-like chemotaxis protein
MSTILVADNSEHWLNVICGLVTREHYAVIRARNPSEALAALDRKDIDIAILDLRLKDDSSDFDISGFRVAKESGRSIPKIIVSNYASKQDFADAYPDAFKIDNDARPAIVDFVEKAEIDTRLIPTIQNALKIKATWSSASQSKIARVLHEDYETARLDAKRHHLISSIIAIIFAVIFFWGAYRLHSADEKSAKPLILIIVGVLVAEVTNYLFGRKLEFLYHRVERYHDELLQTERFGQLLGMSDAIKDERAREGYKLALFTAATSRWIQPGRPAGSVDGSTQPLSDELPTQILSGKKR